MDHYHSLVFEVAELRRQMAGMLQVGTVEEVKGNRMRMNMGKGSDDKPVLSPWLDTANHRGGARERRFYKKGQNLMILAPNGDVSQGAFIPYAPNKQFKQPAHANESGQDEETYQLDDLRVKKTKTGYDIWLEAEQQQGGQQSQQQGGGGEGSGGGSSEDGASPQGQQGGGGGEARMKIRLNNDGGITARVGKEKRFAVNKQGVKMKTKSNWAVVTDDQLICSKEWQIGADPLPDDDG